MAFDDTSADKTQLPTIRMKAAKPLRSSCWLLCKQGAIIHLDNRSNCGFTICRLGYHRLTVNNRLRRYSLRSFTLVEVSDVGSTSPQSLLPLTLQPSKAKVLRRITFTHANLDHRYIGTGRLSGLPFMSSSFNARSAEPISRHLHASRVAVLRCPHRAQAHIGLCLCYKR